MVTKWFIIKCDLSISLTSQLPQIWMSCVLLLKKVLFLYLAKLVQLFEPHSLTEVHGFDWFKGMRMPSKHDDNQCEGDYQGDFEQIFGAPPFPTI